MLHGSDAFLILLVVFIMVVIFLAMLWRIAMALDKIAGHLKDQGPSSEIKGKNQP